MSYVRKVWQLFMALPVLTRASIVVGVIAVALLIAVLRPRPPEPTSGALATAQDQLPTVSSRLPPPPPPPEAPRTEQRGGLKFKSALDPKAMLAKLNSAGPYSWTEREGHYRGEYISTSVPPDAGLRIFTLGPGLYLADIKVLAAEPGGPIDYARVETLVRGKVLPVAQATDIEVSSSFD